MSYNDTVKAQKKKLKKHKKDGGFFIGQMMVQSYSENEETNTASIVFEDGRVETMTLKQWENVRSHDPYNQQEVSTRRFKHVIDAAVRLAGDTEIDTEDAIRGILDVMIEENIDLNGVNWLFGQVESRYKTILKEVGQRIDSGMTLAMSKVFGVQVQERILVKQIHDILMEEEALTSQETVEETTETTASPAEEVVETTEEAQPEEAPEVPEGSDEADASESEQA